MGHLRLVHSVARMPARDHVPAGTVLALGATSAAAATARRRARLFVTAVVGLSFVIGACGARLVLTSLAGLNAP